MDFDAYRVAVTLSVADKISPILGLLSRRLQTTGGDVANLEKRFKSLQSTMLIGAAMTGAGIGMVASLKAPVDAAIEFDRAMRRFKELNLGDAINTDAEHFAKGANLIGVSATGMANALRDMHAVMGHYDEAKILAPRVAQLNWANSVLFGDKGKMDEPQLQALAKVAEMRGGTKSPEAFRRQLELAQKFMSGTGGVIMPTDLQQFSRRAGVAMRGMTDDGFLQMEPLMQEMGASAAGTATMSAYQNLVGGRTTARAVGELLKYGLVDPKKIEYTTIGTIKRMMPGALTGNSLFKQAPMEWIKTILLPHLANAGINNPADVAAVVNDLLSNRTGSNLVSISATQMDKIMKNFNVNKNSMGVDSTIQNAADSPAGKLDNLTKRWTDLKIMIGETLLPYLEKAAKDLQEFVMFAHSHPGTIKALTTAFLGLAASLLFAGPVILLTGAFRTLSLLFIGGAGLARGLGLVAPAATEAAAAIAGTGGLVASLVGLGVAIVGIAALAGVVYAGYKTYQEIQSPEFLKTHPGIAAILASVGDQNAKDSRAPKRPQLDPVKPGDKRQPIVLHSTLKIDGKTVTRVIQTHLADNVNRDLRSSRSTFDPTQTMPIPATSGG